MIRDIELRPRLVRRLSHLLIYCTKRTTLCSAMKLSFKGGRLSTPPPSFIPHLFTFRVSICLITPLPFSHASVSSFASRFGISTGKFLDVHGRPLSSSVGCSFLTSFRSSIPSSGPAMTLTPGGMVKSTATSIRESNLLFQSEYRVQPSVSVASLQLQPILNHHNEILNIRKRDATCLIYFWVSFYQSSRCR